MTHALGFAATLAALPAGPARCACVCVPPPIEQLAATAAAAGAAFIGTVEEVTTDPARDGWSGPYHARFRVDSAWGWAGGARPPRYLTVVTSATSCGLGFQPGETWLVLAIRAVPGMRVAVPAPDSATAAERDRIRGRSALFTPGYLFAERCSESARLGGPAGPNGADSARVRATAAAVAGRLGHAQRPAT